MTEHRDIQPGQPDITNDEDLVFDFRDPTLKLEPGVKITGMKNWTDVGFIFLKLAYEIASGTEPDTETSLNLIEFPSIEDRFIKTDKTYGFYGQSTNFEIEIAPTDLSFIDKRRKTKPDPKLVKTFTLSRRIKSSALSEEGATVSTACILLLSDRGRIAYRNAYDDGNNYTHNFGASLNLKPIDESALRQIRKTMTRPGSVAAERSTPIQMGRRRL